MGSLVIISGVPQESVYGPIQFLVYGNGITLRIGLLQKLFTNDYKLHFQYRRDRDSRADGISQLKEDLNSVQRGGLLEFKLNPEKCVMIRFERKFLT